MKTTTILIIIFISALITFMLRALPFVLFKGERELPPTVKKLGDTLPPAIMAVLIVYCLKDININFMGDGIWKIVAVVVVAVSYKIKHNTLVSILLGTVTYMALLRLV